MIEKLPRKALEILDFLISNGRPEAVIVYEGTQEDIARNVFGYKSRQALSQHLKILRENGLIRTGRGFIEVTQKGLERAGTFKKLAFVLIKAKVDKVDDVLGRLRDMGIVAYKVTGDWDIVAITDLTRVGEIMKIPGVEDTLTLVVIRGFGVGYYLTADETRKWAKGSSGT